MAAVIWIAALGIWWAVSRAFRHADVDKIKNRLTGGGRAKADKAESKRPALIRTEDVTTGKIVLRLLKRYRLTDRLREMLEQAGLRWNLARLIHGCLAMFLAVYAISWTLMPGDTPRPGGLPPLPRRRVAGWALATSGRMVRVTGNSPSRNGTSGRSTR